MISRDYGRSRNTDVRRRQSGRAGRVEVLETRRLLSADWCTEHGDDAHVDGETYVAPAFQPRAQDARRIDLAGLGIGGTGADQPMADSFTEVEPNGTTGTANDVVLAATTNTIFGNVSSVGDVDVFRFTLAQRSGVFLDVDSRETGLSTVLNSELRILAADGLTEVASNDNGDDFETFPLNDTSATARSSDSALYADLSAGTYFIRVASTGGTTNGQYHLKVRASTDYSSTVPVFNSLPGAADTLFLDFDGHTGADSWGSYTIAPYDWSGNAAEWTPGERAAIENVWRVVAEDYAPFNINVTTSFGGTITNAASHRQVIGNSGGGEVGATGSLGVAFLNSYVSGTANNNVSFTFANSFGNYLGTGGNSAQIGAKAVEMGNTSSHEFGHALGLLHYGAANPQTNGIMHTPDFGLSRERWKAGNTKSDESPVVLQTDVSQISSTTNTFGYRADDHGNTRPAATALNNSGNASASGIIGQKTDVDFFSFNATGATTVSVSMLEHVANLDAELYLYDASGVLLGSNDSTSSIFASVTQAALPAGLYYAEVRSDGEEGEIGQFTLNVQTSAVSATPGTPDLLAVSDTGVSSTDNVTNLLNATPATALQFSVSGTVAGALVELLYNGSVIGSATATGTTTTVTTNGTTTLGNFTGVRQFSARQTEPGKLVSAESAALPVLVDPSNPRNTFDVLPQNVTTAGGTAYDIFISFTDGNNGSGVDVTSLNTGDILVTGPNGFSQLAALVALDTTTTPGSPVGTYRLTPPGGSWDAADNGTYTIATRANEYADVAGNFRDPWNMGTFNVTVPADTTAPTVTGVFVDRGPFGPNGWPPAFRSFLASSGAGEEAFGYRIPAGEQTDELPWVNISRFSIRFSENVNVASDDLAVYGVSTATYPVAAFSYDAATFTARWTLTVFEGVANDKLLLDLDAGAGTGVTDTAGNRLDGEWTNPVAPAVSGDTFPSGNGTAGGDFRFRLNFLPGDANRSGGSVIGSDVTLVRNAQNSSPGAPGSLYTIFKDVNGSGTIVGSDVTSVRNLQGRSLPAGEPTAPEPESGPSSVVVGSLPVLRSESIAIATAVKRRLVDDVL